MMESTTPDFDLLYESTLIKSLRELEDTRLTAIRKFKKNAIIASALVGIYIISALVTPFGEIGVLFFLAGLVFISIGSVKIADMRKKIKVKFKKDTIIPILRELYEDVEYYARKKISIKTLNNSLLLNKTVRRTNGDDFVRCTIGETLVQFCEIDAFHTHKSKRMFYSGIFTIVSFNKSFKSKTLLLPEKIGNKATHLKLQVTGDMKNPSIIKLEDINFEKKFIVIGEDQVESRYLLSPSLMQRLYDYELKFNGDVSFSFINNNLYISIPIKVDMFEPRYFSSNLDKEFIKSNYDYLNLLTDVVEELDLNTRIWL